MGKINHRIIIAGFGGQGIILAGRLLCIAAMKEGKFVSHIPSYGAEMRGGTANCAVVISDTEIPSPLVFNPSICLVLNKPSLLKFEPKIQNTGLLIYNSSLININSFRDDIEVCRLNANDIAQQAGSSRSANMAMIGALLRMKSGIAKLETVIGSLDDAVSKRNKKLNRINKKALQMGYEACEKN